MSGRPRGRAGLGGVGLPSLGEKAKKLTGHRHRGPRAVVRGGLEMGPLCPQNNRASCPRSQQHPGLSPGATFPRFYGERLLSHHSMT